MLDIKLFRTNADIIKESEKKRFKDPSRVDLVIEYDNKWRENLKRLEELRRERNEVGLLISKLKKEGKDASEYIKKMKDISKEISKREQLDEELLRKRDEIRYSIGNILHKEVPVGEDESANKVVRTWGNIEERKFKLKSHVDLLQERGLVDLERASKLSGARFYYLKGDLVKLNLALINYALDTLAEEGFILMQTPYMLRKEYMKKAAELADFEETLYKIDGEDLFLIATAEQTLASYRAGELLQEQELPIKYAGFSTNFRKEAGAHGKDTKGIFRVHQFEKIEQYVITKPEDSWEWHEKLISIAERIMQGLELPYRIVDIASGDMNDNAARKYDLEAWMPVQNTYRELVSCSNTTDYQARKLGIRLIRKDGTKEVAHTLNSTAIATERTIVAIVENHQTEDGRIRIPKVLQKYMGKEYI